MNSLYYPVDPIDTFLDKHMVDPAARSLRQRLVDLEHELQATKDDLEEAKQASRVRGERASKVLGLIAEHDTWRTAPADISSQTAKLVRETLLEEIARELR